MNIFTNPNERQADAPLLFAKPRKRPILVWIICLFNFLYHPLILFYYFVVLPCIASGEISVREDTRKYVESLTAIDYAIPLMICLINLSGAIFLFFQRRVAFYLFCGGLVLGILYLIYQFTFEGAFVAVPSNAIGLAIFVIGLALCWGLAIAVVAYIGYLYATKVLR